MELCAKCGKNPAVLYITKMEGDKVTNEGLCLSCAKSLGIKPLNNMMEQMGIHDDDDIEKLNSQMSEFIDNMGGLEETNAGLGAMLQNMADSMGNFDGEEEGGAATAPLDKMFGSLFGNLPIGDAGFQGGEAPHGDTQSSADKKDKKKKRNRKKSMLETYGTNLTEKAALGKVDRVVGARKTILFFWESRESEKRQLPRGWHAVFLTERYRRSFWIISCTLLILPHLLQELSFEVNLKHALPICLKKRRNRETLYLL